MNICASLDPLINHPQKWFDSLDLAADWVGLRIVDDRGTTLSLRDGQPHHPPTLTHQRGAMVEVQVAGHFAYAATPDLSPEGLRQAAHRAYRQAQSLAQWGVYPHSPGVRPVVQGADTLAPPQGLSLGETVDLLRWVCQELRSGQGAESIVQTHATAHSAQGRSWLLSSQGTTLYREKARISTHYAAIAQDGPQVQQRTDHGYYACTYRGGWERVPQESLGARARQVGEEAVALLSAPDCPTETTTLVLAPDQMLLQIHESVGHPLELDRILGDERNYAGGSFVQPEDFGRLQYGSPLMTVTFDPTVEEEIAAYGFDDTGHRAERVTLIDRGLLVRGLGSLESQERLGLPGVACGRATSWNRPPIDRMANLNLEPGTTPLGDLLASIERGVYMHTNRSWSIDDRRYKFQFGCELAYAIENGEIKGLLRNPNYRAVTPQFWHSLRQVGDGNTCETYGSPVCGKGEPNQMIDVGHRSPVCVFEGIEVFGGG